MTQTSYFPLLFLFTISISLASSLPCSTPNKHKNKNEQKDLVYSSCANASYPNLCIQTLSSYSGKANTPSDLAKAAVGVSLAKARNVSESLETLKGHTKREINTLNDCMEQVGDSVYDLKKTLNELQHLRRDSFEWQMSNAQTWVSAALTNQDSCVDGFKEIDWKVRADLKKKISIVAKVTSNALYLINLLDESQH
ncbi:hypothetical protein Leryth_009197 [Lithospermum erythrorhizon]|uniref:Pectinesterase inhibitor domain-containing protein n=1 Tax=Lithospermum erythrorhizon TaxID=34254 RepID=A0AAV3P4Q3_LITER|nr:hypothetical protein Leryth_009197 [Lithospermum erythrorhizon]